MDMMSMVTSLLAMQAGNVQMQVAATIMKSNADAEKSAVMTLLGAGQAFARQSRRRHRRQSRYLGLNSTFVIPGRASGEQAAHRESRIPGSRDAAPE